MASLGLIYGLIISGVINALFILALFIEPYRSIAREATRRFYRSSSNKVRCVFFGKNGNVQDKVCSIQKDGTVEYKDDSYMLNPKLQFNFWGVQTQFYNEGEPEPINPFGDEEAQRITTRELNTVMIGGHIDDFLALLKQYKPVAIAGVAALVILAFGSLYLNWRIFDIVVQGGSKTLMPN